MNDDPAKARVMVLHAVRWVGAGLVILGLLVVYGRIALPIEAGYVLVVVGLVDALIMPTVLARRWRSPLP